MILEQIADKTRERIEVLARQRSLGELKAAVNDRNRDTGFPFEKALAKPEISFIC